MGAAADRLRALIPRALNGGLESGHQPTRLKVAAELLKLAWTPDELPVGPFDPDDIYRQRTLQRWATIRGNLI